MKKTLGAIAALLAVALAVVVLGLISIQSMTPDAPSAGDEDLKPEASAAGPDDARFCRRRAFDRAQRRGSGPLRRVRAPDALHGSQLRRPGKGRRRNAGPPVLPRRRRRAPEALDKSALLDAARRLSALQGGAAALQAGLRFEYLGTANMLDHLPQTAAKGPGGRWYHAVAARSRYIYQPLRTRALYAGRFRGLVEEAGKDPDGKAL